MVLSRKNQLGWHNRTGQTEALPQAANPGYWMLQRSAWSWKFEKFCRVFAGGGPRNIL